MTRGRANVRLILLLQVATLAALSSLMFVALGLPLLAHHAFTPERFVLLATTIALMVTLLGAGLLFRSLARPVERMITSAKHLGGAGAEASPAATFPILGEPGGLGLSHAAVAFERLVATLGEERAQLAEKVTELTRANRELAEARESLIRSEKLATVGRLAAGIAHEVGNPLGAIAGYAALARSKLAAGQPVDDFLVRIAAEAERIDDIVRGLLDFARPAKLSLAGVRLSAAIDASLRLARMQERFRAVDVRLLLPDDLPKVLAEERALAQVLLNLFLNAGDAMNGTGTVEVEAHTDANDRGHVTLAVSDSGPGIRDEDLVRIFDPFFTTKEPGAGTGLGLAICHRIMESFEGEISAANQEGGGASFTLRLRRAGA